MAAVQWLVSPVSRAQPRTKATRRRDIIAPVESLAGQIHLNPTRSSQIFACDLPDKLDDASTQPRRLYPHERLNEREPVGRGEELRHISGPRRLYNSL